MTTTAAAREAVYGRFVTNWEAEWPDVPYVFDNEAANAEDTWVRVSVRHLTSTQDTLGVPTARRWRRRALAFVQIFTPVNAGAGGADDYAETVRSTFEGTSFSGLDCEATLIREGRPDGRWWLTLAETPFSYYETR